VIADGDAVSRHPVIGEGEGRAEIGRTPAGRTVERGLEGIALTAAQPLRQAPIGAAAGEREAADQDELSKQLIVSASCSLSGNVRLRVRKWANVDIDQVAVTNRYECPPLAL